MVEHRIDEFHPRPCPAVQFGADELFVERAVDEAQRDRLVEPEAAQGLTDRTTLALALEILAGAAPGRQRRRHQAISDCPGHLLDEVLLDCDVDSVTGADREQFFGVSKRLDGKSEPAQRVDHSIERYLVPDERFDARATERDRSPDDWMRVAVHGSTAHRTAGNLDDERRGAIDRSNGGVDIGATLEPVRGIRVELECTRSPSNTRRLKVGRLEKDVDRRFTDSGSLAALDSSDRHRDVRIGDDEHVVSQFDFAELVAGREFLERHDAFAGTGAPHDDPVTAQQIEIERVQRVPLLEQYVVRHVRDVVDRTLAEGLEATDHPVG